MATFFQLKLYINYLIWSFNPVELWIVAHFVDEEIEA